MLQVELQVEVKGEQKGEVPEQFAAVVHCNRNQRILIATEERAYFGYTLATNECVASVA